jgi:hypothetical protein
MRLWPCWSQSHTAPDCEANVAMAPFQRARRGARMTQVRDFETTISSRPRRLPRWLCQSPQFLDKWDERDTRDGDGIRILRHVRHTTGRDRSEVLRRVRVNILTCGFTSATGPCCAAARPGISAGLSRRATSRRLLRLVRAARPGISAGLSRRATSRRILHLVRAARPGISAGLSRRATSRLRGPTHVCDARCPRREGQGLHQDPG